MFNIKNQEDIDLFLQAVDDCKNDVYLLSIYGDRFSLKSVISRYVGIGQLLSKYGGDLELFTSSKDDEVIMLNCLSKLHQRHEDNPE